MFQQFLLKLYRLHLLLLLSLSSLYTLSLLLTYKFFLVILRTFFSSTPIEEKTEDFSPCIAESGQAANVEKTKYILKYHEEERRKNRNVMVANTFFENVANL